MAGGCELGGPAGVASWGCGEVEAVIGVATFALEGGRSRMATGSRLGDSQ